MTTTTETKTDVARSARDELNALLDQLEVPRLLAVRRFARHLAEPGPARGMFDIAAEVEVARAALVAAPDEWTTRPRTEVEFELERARAAYVASAPQDPIKNAARVRLEKDVRDRYGALWTATSAKMNRGEFMKTDWLSHLRQELALARESPLSIDIDAAIFQGVRLRFIRAPGEIDALLAPAVRAVPPRAEAPRARTRAKTRSGGKRPVRRAPTKTKPAKRR